MIAVLSGGTGTPKLLVGLREWMDDAEIAVVVNTAEDIWMSGNHISPDLDTVMYLFAGILNTGTWWGIEGDTFHTHRELQRIGGGEYISIGDRDRAVHILRGEMLRSGRRLTEITKTLCRSFGVRAGVLPMTDSQVTTIVTTPLGEMHFQEYWVRHRGSPEVLRVGRRSGIPPIATREVLDCIANSDAVLIGPSNPVTSIMPILECGGMKEVLAGRPVVAVSPFMGDRPFSGPAAPLMRAWGMEPDARSVSELYRPWLTVFVQDIRDPHRIPGAHVLDTLMTGPEESRRLAGEILKIIENII